MELFIIARFHAREGQEAAVAAAIADNLGPTRQESGCRMIQAYRSIRDPRLHHIYSRWTDEAAFELHAALPHTVGFLARVEPLIDHPLDVTRARPLDA
jgi:quinol monooxygenase YgiN